MHMQVFIDRSGSCVVTQRFVKLFLDTRANAMILVELFMVSLLVCSYAVHS